MVGIPVRFSLKHPSRWRAPVTSWFLSPSIDICITNPSEIGAICTNLANKFWKTHENPLVEATLLNQSIFFPHFPRSSSPQGPAAADAGRGLAAARRDETLGEDEFCGTGGPACSKGWSIIARWGKPGKLISFNPFPPRGMWEYCDKHSFYNSVQ